MSTTITAQVKVRFNSLPKGTQEVKKLIEEGFVITNTFEWGVGANYGGERPEHVGFVVNLEKTVWT